MGFDPFRLATTYTSALLSVLSDFTLLATTHHRVEYPQFVLECRVTFYFFPVTLEPAIEWASAGASALLHLDDVPAVDPPLDE
jgi:hypothetical protein